MNKGEKAVKDAIIDTMIKTKMIAEIKLSKEDYDTISHMMRILEELEYYMEANDLREIKTDLYSYTGEALESSISLLSQLYCE